MAFSGGGGTGNKPFSPFTITANQAAQHQQPAGTSFAFGTGTPGAPAFSFGTVALPPNVSAPPPIITTTGGGTGNKPFSPFTITTSQAVQPQQPAGTTSFAFGTGTPGAPAFSLGTTAPAPTASAPQLSPITTTAGGGTGNKPFSPFTITASQAVQPQQTAGTTSFAFGTGTTSGAPAFSFGTTAPSPSVSAPQPITTTAAGNTGTTGAAGGATGGAAGDASSNATTQLSSATTTTQSNTAVSQMNFRQLQEAINKWMLDLQEQEKIFLDQATKVNAWDRSLIANGDKIAKLNESITKVKNDHTRLEHALDYLKTQQQEFEAFLEPLEAGLPVNIPVEPEREHLYNVTESVDTQLQQMAEDLKEVIRHINESNKTVDKNDPISQILRILNEHTDALQWVEDNANQVRRSLEDVSKQHQMAKKEHERSLRQMFK